MTPERTPTRSLALVRRVIVGVIVVSFSVAAILGIVVLLGLEIGETTGRVLATTAIVGAFSVAVLCCAALIGRPLQAIGLVGAVVAILTGAFAIVTVWIDALWRDAGETTFHVLWTGVAASAAFALASLLLLLGDRRRPVVRIGLVATVVLLTVLLALTLYLIWARELEQEVFPRVYGIVAILAALGAVVVPVLSLLLPDARAASPVNPALAERLAAEAQRRGITVEELVAPLFAPSEIVSEPDVNRREPTA